nr:type II secretion system protein GspG [Oscillatoria laete-virens]
MSVFWYILKNPAEAVKAVIHGYKHPDDFSSTAEDEGKRLNSLKLAIAFYKNQFGRLPEKLEDLCFNNHQDASWNGVFIKWQGKSTFIDLFGQPYYYHVEDGKFNLSSPGLDDWNKKKETKQGHGGS